MKIAGLLKAQLEREAASSRRTLERVPEGHNKWKPHPKSMELGYLAALVAKMPSWIVSMVKQNELDIRSADAKIFTPGDWSKRGELLEIHEKSVTDATGALSGATDEHLVTQWKFVVGGTWPAKIRAMS